MPAEDTPEVQKMHKEVLVYSLLVPESLYFVEDITAAAAKTSTEVLVPECTAWFVCAPRGTGPQRHLNSPSF